MKIVTIVRTLNEEKNIERFCDAYQWADNILIADGGSIDRTLELAKKFSNVQFAYFGTIIELENGFIRNPHGKHINFLIDWATIKENADWIVFDDCDSIPNKELRKNARAILEETTLKFVMVPRIYLWHKSQYFPNLSKDDRGNWTHALWAWRASTGLRYREDDPLKQELDRRISMGKTLRLLPPYCLLHNCWPNSQEVKRKLSFYRKSGEVPDMQHPLQFGGPLEDLPKWAIG